MLCLVGPRRLVAGRIVYRGRVLGGLGGIRLARHLAVYKHALSRIFSGTVITVGIYVIIKSLIAS
jgi:hypothetical protein